MPPEQRREKIIRIKATLADKDLFMEEAKLAFDELDIDKNGVLDQEEMRKYARAQLNRSMLKKQTSGDYATKFIQRYDADKSGGISLVEFATAYRGALEAAVKLEETLLLQELEMPAI